MGLGQVSIASPSTRPKCKYPQQALRQGQSGVSSHCARHHVVDGGHGGSRVPGDARNHHGRMRVEDLAVALRIKDGNKKEWCPSTSKEDSHIIFVLALSLFPCPHGSYRHEGLVSMKHA
ncbi:hypothetical protein OsJ_06744 [Oryza sativa Japonica Group]|uniref:Uncharacterized protein n=1 Tax=Oryza sativa subsp. japonica TaxID=39947 RepID=B9F006_ORYSJ|nr:hypothetical protein OsJ_06744 [Oryza sativa Japonica Group]